MTDPPCSRPAQTRQRLITAALERLRHAGALATSVDEIAATAGVTKPTLYRHFLSKDELVVACLREEGRQIRLALHKAFETAPEQRIRTIAADFAGRFSTPPCRGLLALNLAAEYVQAGTPVRLAIQIELESLQDALAALVAAPQARKLALAIFGASAACQAIGPAACETLIEVANTLAA